MADQDVENFENDEIELPKRPPGRPRKPIDVEAPESEPEEVPEEPIKKKKVASEKQLQALAKARAKRAQELKKYSTMQKEKAVKDSEEFFQKKIEQEVQKRLAEALPAKKTRKPAAKKPVAKKPVAKKATKPKVQQQQDSPEPEQQYYDDYYDPFQGIC